MGEESSLWRPQPLPQVDPVYFPAIIFPPKRSRRRPRDKKKYFFCYNFSRPVVVLDPWNDSDIACLKYELAYGSPRLKNPDRYERAKKRVEECKPHPLDAWELRNKLPDHIPVSVQRDEWSFMPLIDTTKYQVRGDTPLEEFADFIRRRIVHFGHVFLYFKRTTPTTGALMSAVDEENKDDDGFLYVTYSDLSREENAAARCEITPEMRKPALSQPIGVLDYWNCSAYKMVELAENSGMPDVDGRRKRFLEECEPSHNIDPWKLRKTCPDHIPVIMDKDASSDVPEIDTKKYHVPGNMTLKEFVDFFWLKIWKTRKSKPLFVYFKKTVPARGAVMSAVDEENMDEKDGFVHITYGGEKKGICCASYLDL